MSVALVDDHLLLRLLLGEVPHIGPKRTTLATTGIWYHRLCRALAGPSTVGSLSRQLGEVDASLAAGALGAVLDLPDDIEMVSMRTLGWPMADLVHRGARLNLLSLEALAAARHLRAVIWLSSDDDNGPLRAAAADHGITVRTADR